MNADFSGDGGSCARLMAVVWRKKIDVTLGGGFRPF
jgi:hypothetical protein